MSDIKPIWQLSNTILLQLEVTLSFRLRVNTLKGAHNPVCALCMIFTFSEEHSHCDGNPLYTYIIILVYKFVYYVPQMSVWYAQCAPLCSARSLFGLDELVHIVSPSCTVRIHSHF